MWRMNVPLRKDRNSRVFVMFKYLEDSMKRTLISTAIAAALSLGAIGVANATGAVTVTLLPNTTPGNPFAAASDPVNNDQFNGVQNLEGSAPNEFRVMNNGAVSGNGEKNIVTGAETWTFDASHQLSAVGGTATVPQANANNKLISLGETDVRVAAPGLFQNAAFLFPAPTGDFGFVAPIPGSQVRASFGAPTISFDSTDNFTMFFPVMEAHWANGTFTIGDENGGVTFNCTGATTAGGGACTAERQIDPLDDSLGFANQFTQWEFKVQLDPLHTTSPVPVPAAVWLFGSGLMGLVGVARRRKSS